MSEIDRKAILARAEHIVEVLSTRAIREVWSFDQARAARFLECLRTFDMNDGDSREFAEILQWIWDHGQCLDWIFRGDLGSMIATLASNSPGRRQHRILERV